MIPWERLDRIKADDGIELELRRRGSEYLIVAGGYDLMSSEDEGSSRALSELGCAHINKSVSAKVLIGGLGMGYTLRAALDALGPKATVEVSELVSAVAQWNEEYLGHLAGTPLKDPRTLLRVEDVSKPIRGHDGHYDAILLDVDNGPERLAHRRNQALYGGTGIKKAYKALKPGGVFGVWSFSDDARFTDRLQQQGFTPEVHRVEGSRKGRGRYHVIWIARRPKSPKSPKSPKA